MSRPTRQTDCGSEQVAPFQTTHIPVANVKASNKNPTTTAHLYSGDEKDTLVTAVAVCATENCHTASADVTSVSFLFPEALDPSRGQKHFLGSYKLSSVMVEKDRKF